MKQLIVLLILFIACLTTPAQLQSDVGVTAFGYPYVRVPEASGTTSFNSEIDRVSPAGAVFRTGTSKYVVINPVTRQTSFFNLESGLTGNTYEYARPFRDSMLYWKGNSFYLKSITSSAPARLYWSLSAILPAGQTISDKPLSGDGNDIEYTASGEAIFAITSSAGQVYVLNLSKRSLVAGPWAMPAGADYGSVAPGGDHLYFILQSDRGAANPGTWAYTLQGKPAGRITAYASHTDLSEVSWSGKSCIAAVWRSGQRDTAPANVYLALYQYDPAKGEIKSLTDYQVKNNQGIANFAPACAMSQIHASTGSGYIAYVTSNTEFCKTPPVAAENVNILYLVPTSPVGPAIPIAYTSQRPTVGGSTKDQPEVWVHRVSETQLAVFLRTNRATVNDIFMITYTIPAPVAPVVVKVIDPLQASRDSLRLYGTLLQATRDSIAAMLVTMKRVMYELEIAEADRIGLQNKLTAVADKAKEIQVITGGAR